MNGSATRYPGAQPFSDDALSRKVFFGREREVIALSDQILANRMVVVYARSGLGKTSLLNAGVAQRLRDEGYMPPDRQGKRCSGRASRICFARD
jgi:putative ribosome biogenesis GTPase RsgA